ncbi:MAG TPA: DnaA/Hda family protein [Pirellulales bacterium]|nr:DnaA/Hda family protein [Pirellulales bacterium]
MNGVYRIPLSAPVEPAEFRAGPHSTRRAEPTAGLALKTFDGRSDAPLYRSPVVHRSFIAGAENHLAAVVVERLLATVCPSQTDTTGQTGASGDEPNGSIDPNGPIYSPLVLHGMPGTGKSHLARGLAWEWSRHRPADTVTCLTAAEFAEQFVEAIEAKAVDAWRSRLRLPGLFVVEDLGQLVTRAAAQGELAQTLDALADCGAMVIVTSRVSTAELTGLTGRLQGRLAGGISIPLAPPGTAARVAIVEHLAELRNLTISKSAARLLGESLPFCAPELAGALLQLEQSGTADLAPAGAADWGRTGPNGKNRQAAHIEEPLVRRFLAARAAPRRASLQGIAANTARYFVLRVAELKSPSRRRAVVMARDVAMYLARQLTGKSLKQIGDYFGGRDHTTVLHGCRKTEGLVQSDPATRQAIVELRQGLAI